MSSTVHVVHCIDTEGPLYESVEATFERLKAIFGLDLPPSRELLGRLQRQEEDLGGIEVAVARVVDPHLLAYNDTWDEVDVMLEDCMSPAYRERMVDSFGGGWVYSWFCVDHVDYTVNPRRRDLGYHNVFDHYRSMLRETGSARDGIQLHVHPHPFNREAHYCATHWWANSDSLSQVLSRRVIDRQWFPAANRPGFHVTRPDSHWFLEQHLPFDYASQAMLPDDTDGPQKDAEGARFGDWRRAPVTWEPYHPSHDDHQVPGDCRRWIARCLNVGTRYRLLRERDVRHAFDEAREGKPVVLSFTNHDFRDMRPDIEGVRDLLARVTPDYPDVPFKFSEAVQAMREALGVSVERPCDLSIEVTRVDDGTHVMDVRTATPTFGPQPWLALKTRDGRYLHDNLDLEVPRHHWQYTFDVQSLPLGALESVGVAANNAAGVTTVSLLDCDAATVRTRHWNLPGTEDHA